MNRQVRRRVWVVAAALLVGATAPVWAPPLLARLPLFEVREVGVVGARYVPPDEIVRRADVDPGASVWDDASRWERRVESHPLVREARISRAGAHRLEVQVREAEPVALVATPELVAVDAEGGVLPLDPVESELDLPILAGGAEVEDGRLARGRARSLLRTLVALRKAEPGFVRQVSELADGPRGGLRVMLTEDQACDRVLLPRDEPVAALRRVEMALARPPESGAAEVEVADARFDGQVVLRLSGGAVADAGCTGEGRRRCGGGTS